MKSMFKTAIYVLIALHAVSALAANQAPPTDSKVDDNGYCDEQSLNLTIPPSMLGVYANSRGYKLDIRSSDDITYWVHGYGAGGIDSDFPKTLASVAAPRTRKTARNEV
jgi:hypothetical protein